MLEDKQIIIDGVDVSGCDFLAKKDDYCSYSGVTYAYKGQCMCSDEEMCKEHPKCFYKKVLKQLKAKEQECERWEAINKYSQDKLLGQVKVVCKLTKTLAEIKEIAEESCCTQATTTCEEYKNCTECGRISDADTIQQILQKIREVEE